MNTINLVLSSHLSDAEKLKAIEGLIEQTSELGNFDYTRQVIPNVWDIDDVKSVIVDVSREMPDDSTVFNILQQASCYWENLTDDDWFPIHQAIDDILGQDA